MFACRWFRAFAFLSIIANAVHAAEEVISTSGLSQEDAEAILNVQSDLRRQLISSLADVGERINRFERFHSVLRGVIQDLQSRNVDPFKPFKSGVIQGQPTPLSMAETIYCLQGATTLTDWKSLLQTIPNFAPFQPNIQLTAKQLEKIHTTDEPFVAVVLTAIQKNRIKLNERLLEVVLQNYPFGDDSPDMEVISENLNRMLEGRPVNFSDFHPDPSAKGPDAILSDVLKYVARKSDSGVAHQIGQLLPALSGTANVLPVDASPQRLFDLMLEDDYPADIVQAKNALSSAVGNNQTSLEISAMAGGRSPMEKLLILIAKLTSLPGRSSLRKKVHAVYPHVKLRYLAGRGKFFRPRTASDVGFLLNSFLTSPDESSPTLFREIRKVFSDFNWEEGLKNFDYSRYSKPRPLVIDMFEELLNNSNKLPFCGVILIGYFLRRNHREVSSRSRIDDFLVDFPTERNKEYPTTPVKRCPDGDPVTIVDPESIIEAMSPNRYSDFISDLIRFKPIGYTTGRRVDVLRGVLNGVRSSDYEKILSEVHLNEKADLPPKYVNLCPYEVASMEPRRQPPVLMTPTQDSSEPSPASFKVPLLSSLTPATSLRSDESRTVSPQPRFPFVPVVADFTFPDSTLPSATTIDYSEVTPLTCCDSDSTTVIPNPGIAKREPYTSLVEKPVTFPQTLEEGSVTGSEESSTTVRAETVQETTVQESVAEQADVMSASSVLSTTEVMLTQSEESTTPDDENEWLANLSTAGTNF